LQVVVETIGEAHRSALLRTVRAAIDKSILLNAVPNDVAAAMLARGR